MKTAATKALSFDSEHRLRSENLAFDIDNWYPVLRQFTARSVFIPLKKAEGEAIRGFHDVSWRKARPSLTLEEVNVLEGLERDISFEIENSFSSCEKGVFMRLCGRSPKGSTVDFDCLI